MEIRKIESPEFTVKELRKKIKDIEETELSKGEEYGNPHFFGKEKISDSLAEADWNIYKKFINKNLSKTEFFEYQASFSGFSPEHPGKRFMGWLANQLMNKENQEWFDPENYKKLWGDEEKKQ